MFPSPADHSPSLFGGRLRIATHASTPLDMNTLDDFWRQCRYHYTPQYMVRFAQYCQLYLLHHALVDAGVHHPLIPAINPRRLNLRALEDFSKRVHKRVIFLNTTLSCPDGHAITWYQSLEGRIPTLTSHTAWKAAYAKITLLQTWVDFVHQHKRWAELGTLCQCLSRNMIPHDPHPDSDTMLALWESPGELASTVTATLDALDTIRESRAPSSSSRYYANSCSALIHYRLTKTPQRHRLYTLLETLARVIKHPSFLISGDWPIPPAVKTRVMAQCQQHLPTDTLHGIKISRQDHVYLRRFLGDINRGLYPLVNAEGHVLKWDTHLWAEQTGSDLDFAEAYQRLAILLDCDVKVLVKFARDAKGQRLSHFLLDQFNTMLEPYDGPIASSHGQTYSLVMDSRFGLILRIACPSVIVHFPKTTGMQPYSCPVSVMVNLTPGFLRPTIVSEPIQYIGEPSLCTTFAEWMAGKSVELKSLFPSPMTAVDEIRALIDTHFSDLDDETIHTALITCLQQESAVMASESTRASVDETRLRANLRPVLQAVLARFPPHIGQDLFLDAIYDPFHPDNIGRQLGVGLTAAPPPDYPHDVTRDNVLDLSLALPPTKADCAYHRPGEGAGAGAGTSPPTTPTRLPPTQGPATFHSPASAASPASAILEDWQTPPRTTPIAPPRSPWRDQLSVYRALAASRGRRSAPSTPERSPAGK